MTFRSIGTCVVSMPLRSDLSKDSDTGNSKVVTELSYVQYYAVEAYGSAFS